MFAGSRAEIDNVVKGLKKLGMDLEEEDEVTGFLGVLVRRLPNMSIELLQTGLIQRTIDALQISHLLPKKTPAKLEYSVRILREILPILLSTTPPSLA
jgi:hypothetical protein